MRRIGSTAVAVAIISSLVGLTTVAQGPSTSPAAPPLDLTPDGIDSMTAELIATDLDRSGLTARDPELAGILIELQQLGAQDLRAILSVQEPLVVPGVEGRRQAIAMVAGAEPVRAGETFDQGGALLGILGSMVVEAGSYLEGVRPGPGSAVLAPPPYKKSGIQTVRGREVATQQTVTIQQAIDQSTASLGRQMSETYAVPGKDGQLQATVQDSATVQVRIDVCPDAQGVVRGHIETQAETRFTYVNGPEYHAVWTGSDDIAAQVNDQAEVGAAQHSLTAHRRATGRRPAFGTEPAANTDVTLTLQGTHSTGAGGQASDTLTVTEDVGADAADVRIASFVSGITRAVADEALRAAATVWKNGRCLKVVATPPGQKVDPGSQTPIRVAIRHIVEEVEVPRKVRATLSGPASIDPPDTPVDAPTTVTYLAPSTRGSGTITFRTVSDRGIAQVSETYVVDPEACPPTGVGGRLVASIEGGTIAQADPTCPPVPVVLEGRILVEVDVGTVYPLDVGYTATLEADVRILGPRGYDWRLDVESATLRASAELSGDCSGSKSWTGSFSGQEPGVDASVEDETGSRWAMMGIDDGPVGMAGGPVTHGERFEVTINGLGSIDATCGLNTPQSYPQVQGARLIPCDKEPDTLTSGVFVLRRTGEGVYEGSCTVTRKEPVPVRVTWTGHIRQVSP
jgi:hypothetical protein